MISAIGRSPTSGLPFRIVSPSTGLDLLKVKVRQVICDTEGRVDTYCYRFLDQVRLF